ncbi:hypothetical protein CKAH01_10087 [Colletotrichum kahawae]|uniref:Uncharacterized protein n=1 Tax=Colletotrichum kahawae TaxID=34407 RepID=A0AAD9XY97_COLKA|nr:hypothetical protein CKAH01_10087 [Colletotrichum kahawae]
MNHLNRNHEAHNVAHAITPLIQEHPISEVPEDARDNHDSHAHAKARNGDQSPRRPHFRTAFAGFISLASSVLVFPLISGWLNLEPPGHESIFERDLTWAPLVSVIRWSELDALLVILFLALYALSTSSFRGARCHDPWQDVIIAVLLGSGFFVVVTVVALRGEWANVFDGLLIVIPPLLPLGIWFSIAIHLFSRRAAWRCPESRD